jgi:hypothetical protein
MGMRKILFVLLLVQVVLVPRLHATSYYPFERGPEQSQDAEVMKVGARVYLFYSGTQDARNSIKINDVLGVYREHPFGAVGGAKETGKVKIVASPGAYYLEGEVIEGQAEPGYLAVKGSVACLITARIKAK